MAKKVLEAVKKVVVKKAVKAVKEVKALVCPNCDGSGLKCSVCDAPDPVV